MNPRQANYTAEYNIFMRRIFSFAPAVHIRYGFIIFIFTSYPLLGSEAIREMTEDMKGGNGGKLYFIRF